MANYILLSFLWLVGSALSYCRNAPARHRLIDRSERSFSKRDPDPSLLYPEYNMSVPIDHFFNDSNYEPHSAGYFNLRYWFDASHYQVGGPVIVLQSGETDATNRLPYLQKGLLAQLAQATNGISVILEHRYYGTSFPTPDLSTENLRFLTTDQALADQTYFAQHILFAGLESLDLTAPTTPYFAYGGSYAGGFVAFLRELYPDTWWGAIASSGVTEAIWDFWQYYEPIREYGPPACIANQQQLIKIADNILMQNNATLTLQLKTAFGLENITYDDDFAAVLSDGIGTWQNRNWDLAVNDPSFDYYCGNISSDAVLWPDTASLASMAHDLISAGGYESSVSSILNPMLNFIGFVNITFVASCASDSQDDCYGTHNASSVAYADKSLSNFNSLSWPYQYCTQWGYLQTGSGVPANELPLISRLLTIDYESQVCQYAFNLTTPADTAAINKYGGYNISYPRLAQIGGEADPWRPVTALATLPVPDQLNTSSTASEPKILIAGAVHHWDENGVFPNQTIPGVLPPPPIADAQAQEIQFVLEWMEEWRQHCLGIPMAC